MLTARNIPLLQITRPYKSWMFSLITCKCCCLKLQLDTKCRQCSLVAGGAGKSSKSNQQNLFLIYLDAVSVLNVRKAQKDAQQQEAQMQQQQQEQLTKQLLQVCSMMFWPALTCMDIVPVVPRYCAMARFVIHSKDNWTVSV